MSGTIVSGTAANQATEAALAAYPGAIFDRVVKLANGDYNVHYIDVNWPHHVFLNQDFKSSAPSSSRRQAMNRASPRCGPGAAAAGTAP